MNAPPAEVLTAEKPIILVIMCGYWPGHDATGPNQSLRQMCCALTSEYSFHIFARDRPFGAARASVPTGRWIEHGSAFVRYAPISAVGPAGLREILRETPHDLLWLNGFHDREFTLPTLALRRLGLVPIRPTILSINGEMAKGALGLKSSRKMAYRIIARSLGLLGDVWFHATSAQEAADIKRWFPWSKGTLFAPSVCGLVEVPEMVRRLRNRSSRIRLVFVGRITPVKNLAFALKVLRHVNARIDFDIYGPIEDRDYWRGCETLIAALPPNIQVRHAGMVANADIPTAIGSADLLFLPSLSENFGHAIFEALACEVPVLIGDQTLWKDLEARTAGWDLPLDRPKDFAAAIEAFARMPIDARNVLRRGARALAERFVAESDATSATRRMLQTVLGHGPPSTPAGATPYSMSRRERARSRSPV